MSYVTQRDRNATFRGPPDVCAGQVCEEHRMRPVSRKGAEPAIAGSTWTCTPPAVDGSSWTREAQEQRGSSWTRTAAILRGSSWTREAKLQDGSSWTREAKRQGGPARPPGAHNHA